MKFQIATAFSIVLSTAQAMRTFLEPPSALGGDVITSSFTLRDGRSGLVHRRITPDDLDPPVVCSPTDLCFPIGWPGRDRSWTPSEESESLCNTSKVYVRDNDNIGVGRKEDCTTLRDYMLENNGSFRLEPGDVLPGMYTGLIGHNTCIFSAGLDPAAPWDGLWIGNEDIADVLTLNLEKYVKEDGNVAE
ncbi:hypothetical protein DL769_009915 [Monosporascus sp. CRB-8-3]|nr:hypothetical protein DL769_009915 [Monosporascus sp. CRB-8-3]